MKYSEIRDQNTLRLLEEAKQKLPAFCNRFFLGISQTTAPLTRLNYAYDLKNFFEFLTTETDIFHEHPIKSLQVTDLNKVETFHVELYADWLSKTNKERAKVRKLSCLRSMFAYFFKKGDIKSNILPNVDLPKVREKPIVRLEGDEVTKMINLASAGGGLSYHQMRYHNKLALRDMTILTFFLSSGCRVSELVGLNRGDIDLRNASFRVTRKGGNETILYMSSELVQIMTEYLGATHEDDLPIDSAPLFTSLQGTRISVRAVQNMVKKYASQAAPLKNISPHKLRSTFGTNLYHATGDIYVVADVLGHSDINTTKKHYASQSEENKRRAANMISVFKPHQ